MCIIPFDMLVYNPYVQLLNQCDAKTYVITAYML